jgi:hypothetical protein
MKRKTIVLLLALLLILGGALGARAATKRDYWYRGKTGQGLTARLKIGYVASYKSTWVTYMSFGYQGCAGNYTFAINGGVKANKKGSFSDRYVKRGAGYLEMRIVHGRVAGWIKKKKAWRRATGTIRVVYNQPSGTEEDPARSCDNTYHWTATRRG